MSSATPAGRASSEMWLDLEDGPATTAGVIAVANLNARIWLESAARRLPAYVPAQGHLAEIDAAEGRATAAIGRLRRLALASDDPDYATHLARVLGESQLSAEAQFWRARAAPTPGAPIRVTRRSSATFTCTA